MLKIFKKGEIIDLAIPTEKFALESEWYTWFNRPDITRYLFFGTKKIYLFITERFFKIFLN